jgi:hypothetical protein
MNEATDTKSKYIAALGLGLSILKKTNIVINNESPIAFVMCLSFELIKILLSFTVQPFTLIQEIVPQLNNSLPKYNHLPFVHFVQKHIYNHYEGNND